MSDDDTEDREIIRKHQFETTGDDPGRRNPDIWTEEEVVDALGEANARRMQKSTEIEAPEGSYQAAVTRAIEKDWEDTDDASDDELKKDWGGAASESYWASGGRHEQINKSQHELLQEVRDSLTGQDADGVAAADVDAEDVAKSLAAMSDPAPGEAAGAALGTPDAPDAPNRPDGTDTPDAPADGESKDMGPFQDHAECVAHFEDVDSVDDPEAACDLVAANPDLADQYDLWDGGVAAFLDELENPDAKSVLTDLEVTHVSGVADPAQDSQWILAKDADATGADWGVTAPLVVKAEDGDREQQKAWAPVLIPNETDKQGDVIPADEIEQAAHRFLSEFRNIDTDHDLLSGKGSPIESWTLKSESTFTRPDGGESREYPEGTWMLGVKFNEDTWKRVKDGDLTGFSIYGEAEEVSTEAFQADPAEAGA
jgi:hypothetical protein